MKRLPRLPLVEDSAYAAQLGTHPTSCGIVGDLESSTSIFDQGGQACCVVDDGLVRVLREPRTLFGAAAVGEQTGAARRKEEESIHRRSPEEGGARSRARSGGDGLFPTIRQRLPRGRALC